MPQKQWQSLPNPLRGITLWSVILLGSAFGDGNIYDCR